MDQNTAATNPLMFGISSDAAMGIAPKAGLQMPAAHPSYKGLPPAGSPMPSTYQGLPPLQQAPAPTPAPEPTPQGPHVLIDGNRIFANGKLVDLKNLQDVDNSLQSGAAIYRGGEIPIGFQAVPLDEVHGYLQWAGQQRGIGHDVGQVASALGHAPVNLLALGTRAAALPFDADSSINQSLNATADKLQWNPDMYGRGDVSKTVVGAANAAAPLVAAQAAKFIPYVGPAVSAGLNMALVPAFGASTYEEKFRQNQDEGMSLDDTRANAAMHGGLASAGIWGLGKVAHGVLGAPARITATDAGKAAAQATDGTWGKQFISNLPRAAAADAGVFGAQSGGELAIDQAYGKRQDESYLPTIAQGAVTGALTAGFMAPGAALDARGHGKDRAELGRQLNDTSQPTDLLQAAQTISKQIEPTVGKEGTQAWYMEQVQRLADSMEAESRKAGREVGYDDLVGPSQPNAGPTIDMFGGKGTNVPHYYTDGTDRPAPPVPPGSVPPVNQDHANDLRRQLHQIQMMMQTHQLTPEQAIAAARAGNEIQEQLAQMSGGRPINPPATAMYDADGKLVRSPQTAFDFGAKEAAQPTEDAGIPYTKPESGLSLVPKDGGEPPPPSSGDGIPFDRSSGEPHTPDLFSENNSLKGGRSAFDDGVGDSTAKKGIFDDFMRAFSVGDWTAASKAGARAAAAAKLLPRFNTLMAQVRQMHEPGGMVPDFAKHSALEELYSIVGRGEQALEERAAPAKKPPLSPAARKAQITKASGGAETQSRLQELIETGKQVWADAKEAIAKLRAKHKSTASVRDDAELKLRLLKDEFDKAAKNRNMGKLLQLQEQMEMFAHRDVGAPPDGKHAALAKEVHDLWRQGRLTDDNAESILNAVRNQKGEKHIMALRDKYVVPAIESKLKDVGDFEKRAKTHDENAAEDANTSVGADKDTVLEIMKRIQLLGGNDLTRHIELAMLINIARRGYTQRDKLIKEDIANRLLDDKDTADLANAAIEEFLTSNKNRNKQAREVNDADLAFAEARSRRMDEGAGQDVGGLTKESRRQVDSLRARINKSNDDGTPGNPWRILNKYASAHYEPVTRDDVMPDGSVVRAVELSATDQLLRDIVSDLHAEPFKKLTDDGMRRIIDIMSKKYSPEVMEVITRHMDLSPIVRVAQARFSRPDNHINRENEYTNRRVVALINELGKDSNVPGVAERRKVLKDKLDEMYEWYRKGMGAGVMRPSFAQFIERLLGSEGLTKMYHGTKGPKGKIQVEMLKLRTDLRNVGADERLGKIGLSVQEAVKGKAEKKESTRKRDEADRIGNEDLAYTYPEADLAESTSDVPRDAKNPPVYSKVDHEPYRVSYELEKNPNGDTVVKTLSAVNELSGKHDDSIEAWQGKTAREVLRGLGQRLGLSHEAFNEMKNAVDADTRAEIARKKIAEESAAATAGERERERNRKEVEKFTSDNATVMKQVSKLEKAGFTVSMGKDKAGRTIITGEKEGTESGKFVRRVITLPKDGKKPTSDIVSSVDGKMAHKQESVPPAHEGVVKGGLDGLTPDVKAELEKSKSRVEIPDVPEAPEAEQGKPKKASRKAAAPTVDERIEKIRDFLADVKAGKARATMPKLLELARSIEMDTKARTNADGSLAVPAPTIPNLTARLGAAVENSDRITGRVVPLKTRAQAITEEKMKKPVGGEIPEEKAKKSVGEEVTDPSDERSVRAALEELAGYGGPGEAVPNKSRIQIYDSVDDVPEADRHLFNDGVAGIAWKGDRAIIVANRTQRGNEKGILLHEVGTHVGLEKLIGADNVRAVADRIHDFGRNGTAVEREAVAAAKKRIPKDTHPEDAHEELIGYTAEELVKRGVTPKGVGKAAQLLRDIRKWVVKALNGTGLFHLSEGKMDGQDLVNLLQGSLAHSMWSPEPAPTKPSGERVMRSVAEKKEDPRRTIWSKASIDRTLNTLPESQRKTASAAIAAMKTASDKWLGMAFLGDLADHMEPYLPSVKRYYDLQHLRSAKALSLTMDIDRHGQNYTAMKKADRDAADRVITMMDKSKVWGYDPAEFGSKRGYGIKVDKASEEAKAFAVLTPEAKKVVAEHFELGHKMMGALKLGLRERAQATYDEAIKADAEPTHAKEVLDAALKKIKKDFPESSGPYSPLVRTGDWVAAGQSKEFSELEHGTAKGTKGTKEQIARYNELRADPEHNYIVHGTRGEMEDMERMLRKEGMANTVAYPRENFFANNEMPFKQIEKLKASLKNMDEGEDGIDRKTQAAALRSLDEMYLSALSDTSARHSSQHRAYVAGFRPDRVIASMEHYKSMAHLIALLHHSSDVHDALERIRAEAKAKDGKITYADGTTATLKGDIQQRKIYAKEILLRHNLNNIHLPPDKFSTSALKLTAGVRIVTSPGFYLQQITEPFMVMLPTLAARHNDYGGAWAAMTKAWGDAKRNVSLFSKGAFDPEKFDGTANEKEMLKYMMERGRIDLGHFTDLGSSEGGTFSHAFANSFGRFMRVATNMEAINRVMSSLTAYRMEMAKNGGDHQKALEATDKLVRISHGEFDAFSTPRYMMRQQWPNMPVRLITQFKKFQVMQVSLLARNIANAFGDAPPEEKKIARAMLGYTFTQYGALTVAMGLPGYGCASTLIDWLLKDKDEPLAPDYHLNDFLAGHMGQTMADLITKGVPGALGAPVTSRLGAGGMASVIPLEDVDLSDRGHLANTALAFMGPFIGMVGNDWMGAYAKMRQGDYYKGMEQLMPAMLRNGMREYRQAALPGTESFGGVTNSKNDVLLAPEDITALEHALSAVGFNSSRMEMRQLIENFKYQEQAYYQLRYDRLAHEYAATQRAGGDTTALRDRWMEYQDAERKLGLLPTPIGGMYRSQGSQLKREAMTIEGIQWNKRNRGMVADQTGRNP